MRKAKGEEGSPPLLLSLIERGRGKKRNHFPEGGEDAWKKRERPPVSVYFSPGDQNKEVTPYNTGDRGVKEGKKVFTEKNLGSLWKGEKVGLRGGGGGKGAPRSF